MLRVPMFYFFLAVPIGGVFMILQLAIKILLDIFNLVDSVSSSVKLDRRP